MLRCALRLLAPLLTPRTRRPDLVLRHQLDTLIHVGPVIDPHVMAQLGQPLVRHLGPALAPVPQQTHVVPSSLLPAEPVTLDLPHRQHDVRVRCHLAVPVPRPMHVQVRHHAARDELLPHEVPCQCDPFGLGQLARQGKLYFARQHCILATFDSLNLIPKPRACRTISVPRVVGRVPSLWRAVGQHDLRMHYAIFGGVVIGSIETLIQQLGRGTISGGSNGAATGGALDDLDREMIDRHAER